MSLPTQGFIVMTVLVAIGFVLVFQWPWWLALSMVLPACVLHWLCSLNDKGVATKQGEVK